MFAAHFRSHGSVASRPGAKTQMKATVAAEEIGEARCAQACRTIN